MRTRRLCALLALVSTPAFCQFSGRLQGTVLDQSGESIAHARISLYLPGGSQPVLATTTASDGTYHLIGVRPTDYDLSATAPGFVTFTLRRIAVDAARETSVQTITLQLASLTQTVDVTADIQSVQTGNAEISTAITAQQLEKLPILDRDPLSIIQTAPGVAYNGNTATVINGMRTSYANMTLDGINIQDNYIRDNALDFTPNKLLSGQVRQLTLVTSNANAAAPGGSAQVAFETPSGTNELHGDAAWYNRNSYFAANDWFNNEARVTRPSLNQNEFAASIGGPIRKDKLFFYANYEAVRNHQQSPATTTILTSDARNGVFTYTDNAGAVHKTDLLALRGIQTDPYIRNLLSQVPAPSAANNFETGDSTPSLLRNTIGYRLNQRDNEIRDNITGRMDYNLSTRHVFTGAYSWNRDNLDRPDQESDFAPIPKTYSPNHSHFVSAAWRWTPSGSLTNELRGGFNLAPGDFLTSQDYGKYLITGLAFTNPVSETMAQGRATDTYAVSDNAAWQRGRHYLQFGFHLQQIRVRTYDTAGTIPTYVLGMGLGQNPLTRTELPGVRTADLAAANTLLATLGGFVDEYSQTFNVTSRTSGFVNGAANVRNFRSGQTDFYAQDNWKVLPRLTLNIGLRWDLPAVVDERDSLALLPIVRNNDPVQTLLSNATLDFAGKSVGRPWYKRDWHDFAPNIGLAWDIFGNGRTAFRAGYSISYVNDQAIVAPESMVEGNTGLVGLSTDTGLSGRVSTSLPAVVPPVYKVPITETENYANDSFNTIGLVDPNLRTPYVQQYSAGIQHEIKGVVIEARYVGNHAVQGYRSFDYNQVDIRNNGFLPDFLRARNNGFLALDRTGVFNPAYNASIPGSQQLPVFGQIGSRGLLTNSTVRELIQTGEPGELAALYQANALNGSVNFFPNPNALGADLLTNYSNSSYNSFQAEVRHRARAGLEFRVNYTFSKVLSDAAGDSQSRIEQFLDVNNPKIERARASFDLTHAFKSTVVYDLPAGRGRWGRLIGGWSIGAIAIWQSGAPFSILSGRGTLNRAGGSRSYFNTANTALNASQLADIVQFHMTGNGPVIIAPSAINPNDGTGVSDDGSPLFSGQAFTNPGPGNIGELQRRRFNGPASFDLDGSIQKQFHLTERQSLELRMEGVNILNHPTFFSGDQNINSQTFGTVVSTFNSPRRMQFALKYRF